jgi:glycosyltransferase involved in cell wall biosynthesis
MEQILAVVGKEWPLFVVIGRDAGATGSAPLVSCIMPTFNRRAYLPLALAAFQSQDYPAKELIVVDDGTDSVRDLLEQQPHTRYFRLEGRRSIGAKRNFACAQANGSIIAHWDDDDWYAPQRLRRQTEPLLTGEADMSGLHDSLILDAQKGCLWKIDPQLHRRMFVGDVHGGTLVFWKRLLRDGVSYPTVNIAEDAGLLRAAQRRGKRLARIPGDGMFIYMRHGRNAWRFEPGNFLAATGWHTVEAPIGFSPNELLRWRQAAAQTS